jgi:hypothetical protein
MRLLWELRHLLRPLPRNKFVAMGAKLHKEIEDKDEQDKKVKSKRSDERR